MPGHPFQLELSARRYLRRLSERYDRPLTLGTVPYEEWAKAASGFDLVWLMGVWRRSPAARAEALRAFPDVPPAEVDASPYAVLDYSVDPSLGSDEELAEARAKLRRAGAGLMLDFVPNHLARDHAWTRTHPGRFVNGPAPDASEAWYFRASDGRWLAHGRDPNFPPWTDTAQLDLFSAEGREALAGELARVAARCDGIRCDMAMLALNSVFERVWGPYGAGARPAKEFWPGALRAARGKRTDFTFLAEAYWGHEWELQELGFDYTYDKTLYERLRHAGAAEVLAHLKPNGPFQRRSAHFVENHDEPRAADAFGPEKARAAAAVCATIPGMRFFHEGQLEGRRLRAPIQLVRDPDEPGDPETARFFERLLATVRAEPFRTGEWRPLEPRPSGSGASSVLAWSWRSANRAACVAIHYSPQAAVSVLPLPLDAPVDAWTGEPLEPAAGGWRFSAAPWDVRVFVPAGSAIDTMTP